MNKNISIQLPAENPIDSNISYYFYNWIESSLSSDSLSDSQENFEIIKNLCSSLIKDKGLNFEDFSDCTNASKVF